jgi:integrase
MTTRNRRAGVEDRWTRSDGQPSSRHGSGLRWLARYVDSQGQEHSKAFGRKADAQQWLDGQAASVLRGDHVAPRDAQTTMAQWADQWLTSYAVNRVNTVRAARSQVGHVVDEFGELPLAAIRPSMVKAWIAKLQQRGFAPNYVYGVYVRLSQMLADAVHDNLLARNPCSKRIAPARGGQKVYVATTEQIWSFHDAMPEHLRAAVLLGAFAGLRIGEVCGLRVADVDFMRGVVHPVQQYGGTPLKTAASDQPVPVPRDLVNMLSASVRQFGTDAMVTDGQGHPLSTRALQAAVTVARAKVPGLPATFSFHDTRHYFASLLIASGADIKTVQTRLRHSSAVTTLDTYSHLWPDADESTRAAVGAVLTERIAATG